MRTIGICAKITSADALSVALTTANGLRARGYEICFEKTTAKALGIPEQGCFAKDDISPSNDLLITFGGDGTLLSVARHAPAGVPIIGVNMGTLGFLTEIRLEDFPAVLDRVLTTDDYPSEERVTFDVEVINDDGTSTEHAVVNDAVINKSALARIIEMRITVGGQLVSTFRADGLIISTPTGSTAYNLSAGGPIIYSSVRALAITPICPHMLTNRPIVLPDHLPIEIRIVTKNQEVFLTLDGQEGFPVTEHQVVRIKKSPRTVRLVHSPEKNYFEVLRTKLGWGGGH
jgi:NAD+ kinase